MKSGKFALALLTCATSSVFAQGSPQCESANLDAGRNIFTVVSPASGAVNQQCFLTVHPAGSTAGRYTEGNYEILLSGGGGGGGGGGSSNDDRSSGGGGQGGAGAVPARTNTYLKPGVYRLTMGTGGLGGGSGSQGSGGNAANGNPTGVAEANTGETIAGYPRAEQWAGRSDSYQVATGRGGVAGSSGADSSGPRAPDGANGSSRRDGASESGYGGGHGFVKLTQLAQASPAVTPAPAVIQQPAPAPVERPMRKDRN